MSGRFATKFVAVAAAAVVVATGMPAASAAADTTPPVLSAVSLSPGPLSPGETFTATVDASDDVAVTNVNVNVIEETTGRYHALEGFRAGNRTVVSAPVGSTWANGTYRIRFVLLYDAAGNYSYYRPGGIYDASPTPPGHVHDVDLASQQGVVSGAADLSPPVLSSFAMTAAAGRAGAPSSFAFAVADTEAGVASIGSTWKGVDSGLRVSGGSLASPPGTGSMSVRLPQAGRWSLESVAVTDTRGNSASYSADGKIYRTGLSGQHDLDLASTQVALAPGPQDLEVVPRPGRVTLVHHGGAGDSNVLSGLTITVQPAGITRDVTVSDLSRPYDLLGLPNGVTQAVTLTAHSTWGDSPVASASGRPVLSGNVTGIADVTRDGRSDVVAQRQYGVGQDPAVVSYGGTGAGGLGRATVYLPSGQGGCERLGAGDVHLVGDGEPLCQAEGLVALTRGGGGAVLGSRGWRAMQWVDGGFSLNADVYPDVIAVNAVGELLVYPMSATGRLGAATRVGSGWGSMISVVSAGDLTGDRRNDVVAVDAAGRLWLYPGNGKGALGARRQIGSGWQSMGALLPLRDLSGDGKADLGAITTSGQLRMYRGTGAGGVGAGIVIGSGWQAYL